MKKNLIGLVTKMLKNKKIVKNLIDKQDINGLNAIMWSCYLGYFEMAKLLIQYKCNPNLKTLHNTCALMFASENPNDLSNIVELLLNNNANINATDNDGDTPLHFACTNNNISVVKILLKYNPNITKNNKGLYPIDCTSNNDIKSLFSE